MKKEVRDYCRFQRKLAAIEYAEAWNNVSRACRTFCVSRAAFYRWKRIYDLEGEAGLMKRKPIAKDHPRRIPETTVEKVLELRRTYHLGPQRIVWYLERYHGITIAFSSVYRILVRNGERQLPNTVSRRELHTCRYAKQVPGHHVQLDVKILNLTAEQGSRIRRYQYTAIDDATRVRALKIFPRHNQENAILFIDYVMQKFPFRINTIRTYREEFYQLLTYKDDVDLDSKLAAWEDFYNLNRPHSAHNGQTPYEALRSMLSKPQRVSLT